MKKHLNLILRITAIILIVLFYFGYKIYKSVAGSEEITGKKENVPQPITEMPPLTKGTADWPNWRGPKLDGKSAFTGIKTDWTKGLGYLLIIRRIYNLGNNIVTSNLRRANIR